MQDRPTVLELLAAVRGFLEDDLGPVLEGRRRFHALVAANVLRIVERELEKRLAERIRSGDADAGEFAERVRAHVRATVVEKLAVANPRLVAVP
ncbi:MAG TPA: DUF6285 domain-containing protein [Candidatus Binatia bacterium]|nr:DUF6285 domain-containing protein [Candidatus Binatia bacterium]